MLVFDSQPPIKDHQPRHLLHEPPPRPRPVHIRHLAARIVKPLPGEGLPSHEEQQEETAAPQAGEDEAHAQPPERPGAKGLEHGVGAPVGDEAADEDHQETGGEVDETQEGGHTQSLKGAVAHSQADKVAVRAVAEEAIDVVGYWFQGGGMGRGAQVGDALLAEHGGDVELLGAPRGEEEIHYGVELGGVGSGYGAGCGV